jgi:putative SOS response-associated peptidase YedK
VPEFQPRYNLCPTDPVLGIRFTGGGRVADMYRWGLVPWWADSIKVGARWINARSEDAAKTKPFREPLAERRLVVPASGFYEWRLEDGRKQAYFFRRPDGRPLAFAGMWDRWGPREAPVISCTVLTTSPSEEMRPYHDRMPVILAERDLAHWLDPEERDPGVLRDLLVPREGLEPIRVGPRVNKAGEEGADLVEPTGP